MFRSARRDVVFPQAEHAVFAAALAALWGNDDFPRPPLPIDAFVRGVALHDRGYGELDTAGIGAVGRDVWLAIQREGFGAQDDDPVVDLVVSLHVLRLVSRFPLAGELRRALPGLLARAAVAEADALAADAVTDLCDRISFDVCCEEPAESGVAIGGRRVGYRYDGERTVRVSPWPFAAPELRVPLTGYAGDGYPRELHRVVEPIRLVPA